MTAGRSTRARVNGFIPYADVSCTGGERGRAPGQAGLNVRLMRPVDARRASHFWPPHRQESWRSFESEGGIILTTWAAMKGTEVQAPEDVVLYDLPVDPSALEKVVEELVKKRGLVRSGTDLLERLYLKRVPEYLASGLPSQAETQSSRTGTDFGRPLKIRRSSGRRRQTFVSPRRAG